MSPTEDSGTKKKDFQRTKEDDLDLFLSKNEQSKNTSSQPAKTPEPAKPAQEPAEGRGPARRPCQRAVDGVQQAAGGQDQCPGQQVAGRHQERRQHHIPGLGCAAQN